MNDSDAPNGAHDPQPPTALHDLVAGMRGGRWEVSRGGCWSWFWHSLELRFVAEGDGSWCFDEVVGKCWLHIEQMDDSYYWMGIHPLGADGQEIEGHDRICVNIGSRTGRAEVRMSGWVD